MPDARGLEKDPAQLPGLDIVHSGNGLVEQQNRGRCGQRAHHFDAALMAVGQPARWEVGKAAHVESLQQVVRHRAYPGGLGARRGQSENVGDERALLQLVEADQQVVDDRYLLEQPDVLEGPGKAEPADPVGAQTTDVAAVERDRARRQGKHSGDQVHDRRLAGAVRTDQPGHASGRHVEGDVIGGSHAAEALGYALERQALQDRLPVVAAARAATCRLRR